MAYAKVNLLLDVKRKRADGYHELEGIMQEISLADPITLSRAEGVSVETDAELPLNNTCRRAAEAFLGNSGYGARIEVKKRIPSEAGLGGASADAAAVLTGLNELYRGTELERSREELFSLGLSIGADVPFCLLGGCAVARGVGERLDPVKGMELHLLIVRGARGVSTGKLFGSLGVGPEERSRLHENALVGALSAISRGDAASLAAELENALQPAAERIAPEIGEYVETMKRSGALGACMTGSGAAVFGIFADEASAERAKAAFTDCDFAEVCRSFPSPAMTPVRFRSGDASDAPLTARLRREAWETTYRGIYPDEAIDNYDFAEKRRRDAERFKSPDFTGHIIEIGGKPIGYLFVRERRLPYIEALYLLKEYRGRGIGRQAFDIVKEYCRERGYDRFTCSCNAHNKPALGFYGRMGGRVIESDMGHLNRQEDQLTLEFHL